MSVRRALASLLAVAAAGCLSSRPLEPAGSGGSLGGFRVESTRLGASEWKVSGCASGDRQSFLGVDFLAADGPLVVRLAIDPIQGPAVRVYDEGAPFDRAEVFGRADCRTFRFELQATGWRIDRVDDYRVTLELDCGAPGRSTLSGKAATAHCH